MGMGINFSQLVFPIGYRSSIYEVNLTQSVGLNNIYSQKNTYVNTTQMVQDLTVSAALIYKSSPEMIFAAAVP